MGWGQWEWNRARDAEDFLRTGDNSSGIASDYGTGSGGSSTGAKCFRSTECAGGFACVNGECINISGGNTTNSGGGTTSGNPSGPGTNCDPDDPKSPCGKSTGGSCDSPGCGQNPRPSPNDCCGTRSCRFTADYVICSCDPLPEDNPCNQFCDSWKKSFGTEAAGCSESKDCGECSSCFAQACEPGGGPCWCDAGGSCGDCEKCDTDPESADFGSCAPAECQECSTLYNYDCGCGKILNEATACRSSLSNGLAAPALALAKAQELCAAECSNGENGEVDPCKGECEGKGYCSDTTGPPPDCPPNTTCTDTGTISAGGVTCWLRDECNKENVPSYCEECDCNCDNDCGNCQICGADGTCQPDPACDAVQVELWLRTSFTATQSSACFSFYSCSIGVRQTSEQRVYSQPMSVSQASRYGLVYEVGVVNNIGICSFCKTLEDGQKVCDGTRPCAEPNVYAKLTLDGAPVDGLSGWQIGGCLYRGVCNITADNETEWSDGVAELFVKPV